MKKQAKSKVYYTYYFSILELDFYKIENSQNLQDELQTTKFLNNSKLFNYQYFLELKIFKLDFLIIHTIPEYHNSKQNSLGSIIFTIL